MNVTLYNVTSADGFIATHDRKEDFIPDELWNAFIGICMQHDVLVWGKHTYEQFKQYDPALIDQFLALPIRKIILTRETDFIPEMPFTAVHSVQDISGENVLVSGSHVLNDLFIKEHMVQQVVVNVLPVMIGEGIPQFHIHPELTLVSEESHTGWITKTYSVR